VNGHSKLPRNPLFYLNNARRKMDAPMPVGNTYWYSVLWVCLYYLAATALKPMFRHYVHHRPLTVGEVPLWLRSIWRKGYYTWKERGVAARLLKDFSGRFFLVPLQVHNDSQVQVHSDYDSVAHFIRHTVASFAAHASKKTVLVIKHHPMDRAYHDYTVLIRELIAKHSLQKRCFYIHDQHLPSLLKHTCGVVVVNSTVALSALFHKAPVKVCGKAIYDMAGLTFQGPLARFWRQAHASRPNHLLYQSFVAHLIEHTQLNGSFYKRLQIPMLATGLSWKERSAPSAKGIRSQSGRPTLSLVKKDAS